MSKVILPGELSECRRRSRLCALRAMDRLGLLCEEHLSPTLARRPALRWLAEERGARWGVLIELVLIELGRTGEPGAFEPAVEWTLENRPRPEEVKAYIRRFRAGIIRPVGASRAGRLATEGAAASDLRPRRASGKEERRRCWARSSPYRSPPAKKGKRVAWAVAWLALVMGIVLLLLSMVLPLRPRG